MEIEVSTMQGRVPVAVLLPKGRIDGSNYQELIAAAQAAYVDGARAFLLDLFEVNYISSAALVAIHTIVVLTSRGVLPDEESGWEAFRAIERDAQAGYQAQLKLLNPQPPVEKVLHIAGMDQFLQVFTDLQTALDAF